MGSGNYLKDPFKIFSRKTIYKASGQKLLLIKISQNFKIFSVSTEHSEEVEKVTQNLLWKRQRHYNREKANHVNCFFLYGFLGYKTYR